MTTILAGVFSSCLSRRLGWCVSFSNWFLEADMAARIISAICRLGAALAELFLLKRKKDEREAPSKAAQEIRQAIAEGDQEAVNLKLEEARLKRQHGSILVCVLAAVLLVAACLLFGCVRTRLYVTSADRECVPMEVDGRKGWWVPEAMFADLSEAYVREPHRAAVLENVGK